MLHLIIDFLTQPIIEGVTIAPAWWAPLAISGGISLVNSFLGKGKQNAAQSAAQSFKADAAESRDNIQGRIADITTTSEGIDTDQSPEELYGDLIQKYSDRVKADQVEATNNVFRTMMSTGGDVSGTGAALVGDLQQKGQRSISDIISEFTQMADRRNLQAEARKDRLNATALNAESGLFQSLNQLFANEQGRADRMGTANKQFGLDVLGIGSQLAGTLYEG